ncbi:MAG: transcriptional regulator TbsP [Halobellus sp.]|uniref:transcriptional regulator TbsP n=1 Tax=Halobellus sp. TaxID=1979212 RepID=UPI0035D47EE7
MSSETNVLADSVEYVLTSALPGESDHGPVYVVGPTSAIVETLVTRTLSTDDSPGVRVLATEQLLKSATDDFLVASNAADLLDSGALDLRTVDAPPDNSLVVTDSSIIAVVTVGDRVAGLSTEDDSLVDTAADTFAAQFTAAREFSLRTPALSDVRESLEAALGANVREEFDAVLTSLETVQDARAGLDEVTISLLVAARNEVLLYDVSKWGEDVGIASKATFSRTKTELEESGLIKTEKVPIDVGRPRLRLDLADNRLREADVTDLAAVARDLLY